ncbi:Poly(ADP-ribose) glycohydrolase [Frankliniella fusca]|uniref:poly(ADP-ribose) glycohydrolase n=1 Tax=Frankliniella fusca TaxID=407009 RepID=A0AAE1HG13_9NEOP|nr:Poly(ADP-ribose) glycohydrolase [Frankliniella fusca]
MALVMLPCDVPWWPTLVRHLQQIAEAKDPGEFVEGMLKIHNMCNVGLDPDEPDRPDQTVFDGLRRYLEEDLSAVEREHVLRYTAPAMVRRALALKDLKPAGGLHFSLQQQGDRVEYDRAFIASLLAHAFFSSYPKRTPKTHPTLQDCNFSLFFRNLDQKCQKAKLKSIWRYFDELELDTAPTQKIIISREVMTGREWLTIEDWLECGLPLCPLAVRHEGRIERAEPSALRVCFASSRLGGAALEDGASQEAVQFTTCPELVAVLLRVEALEDNEALIVENLLQVSRIADPRHRATFEAVPGGVLLAVCCVDAENYRRLPLSQFEEDNVLRELNKALLGFRQHRWVAPPQLPETAPAREYHQRRLSPIGESFSSTQSDAKEPQQHPDRAAAPAPTRGRAPPKGRSVSPSGSGGSGRPRQQAPAPAPGRPPRQPRRPKPGGGGPPPTTSGPAGAAARRGRFIVLGSSGECLPVSRRKLMTGGMTQRRASGSSGGTGSLASQPPQQRGTRSRAASRPPEDDSSGTEEFHSAQSSLEGSDEHDGDGDGQVEMCEADFSSSNRII